MSKSNTQGSKKNTEENMFSFEKPNMGFDEFGKLIFSPVQSTVALLEFISSTLFNILRMACVPAELIFRRNFGERHFNLYLYFGGLAWFWIFAFGFINIPLLAGVTVTPLVPSAIIFTAIGIVFFVAMIWHIVIRKFRSIDVNCYTRYDGDVLPFLYHLPFAKDSNGNPKEYLIRQVYEPSFIIILGIIVMCFVNPQTGSWLALSALGMAVKEYVHYQKIRNLILDQIDADIVGRNMKAAIKGESTKNTQGIYIAGLPKDGKLKDQLINSINTPKEPFTAK